VAVPKRSWSVALVATAAALWGTDALFRNPLAQSTGVGTIVFGEHVVLALLTLPFLLGAVRALSRLGIRQLAAAVAIGAGASALATILFTQAFIEGGPITPVVIQKVQPVIAVLGAWLVLKERPRPRFAWYLLAALAGTWLMAFSDPTDVSAPEALRPALFALGAAGLWAFGTVLGRYLSRHLRWLHITTLRFAIGLPASAVAILVLGQPAWSSAHDSLWIAVLALVTGAVALSLYYVGLRRTPAVTAALAELAFPITAVLVGFLAFDETLTASQWAGVVVTSVVVTLLPLRPRDPVDQPAQAAVPAAATS
jgi:drug/metabolite transporter, DME family